MPTKKRRIYSKPLLSELEDLQSRKNKSKEDRKRDQEAAKAMRKKALQKIGPIAIHEIKKELDRHSFKSPPTRLKKSFTYSIQDNQLIIRSDHPAATFLEEGVRKHQMTYLNKEGEESKTIPIMKDDGRVIFRQATEQTMEDGSWFHPGIQGEHFIEKAVDRARQRVKREMKEEYKEYLQDKVREKVKGKADKIKKRLKGLKE
jgi:hypothetical protein